MPTFDQVLFASRPRRSRPAAVRSWAGKTRPPPRCDWRRATTTGAAGAPCSGVLSIVVTLAGGFCGSAFMMRANGPTLVVEAKRLAPADLDPVTTGSIAVTSDACRAGMEEVARRATWTNARPCGSAEKNAP